MAAWFRKKSDPPKPLAASTATPPPLLKANPAVTSSGSITFKNARKSWTEHFDTVQLAASVLQRHGHTVRTGQEWIEHVDSGLILQPRLVEFQPLDNGKVQTVTTIQTSHPRLCPDGVFEFQHWTGDNTESSLSAGFDQWAQCDLVAFLDALRDKPATCMTLEMEFPAEKLAPARKRRMILSPIAHYRQRQPAAGKPKKDDDHDFCPCCLFTNTAQAFTPLLESDAFFAIRFFALRDENGAPAADCRINGEDSDEGKEAILRYVATWPDGGLEFRKQYVIVQRM